MIGGPQMMLTVFSGLGATFSSSWVIRPTLCGQPSAVVHRQVQAVSGAARQESYSSGEDQQRGWRAALQDVR
jgi:hypothetical protein